MALPALMVFQPLMLVSILMIALIYTQVMTIKLTMALPAGVPTQKLALKLPVVMLLPEVVSKSMVQWKP